MSLPPLIDSGRFRAPCGSCDREIARGEPRVSEPVNDGRVPNAKYRHHHFECALDKLPKLVHRILIDELFDTALISDPSALKVEVYDRILALEAGRPPPPRRVLVVPDPRIERELMPALIANPEDRDVLAVLADLLTERGDPRGSICRPHRVRR